MSIKIAREQWAPMAIIALAAGLRIAFLGMKPPHFDEGVNGWFLDQMKHTGFYHYDPANYHGPFHFYLLFLFYSLMGRTVWALRLPVALIGVLTVWLTLRFERFLPRKVCLIAALAMAVSPAMVFYTRYAIHESELVFFLLLTIWGAAGLMRIGAKKYLWAAGLGAAGLILTKETYVIHFACFALAGLCLWIWEKVSASVELPMAKQQWTLGDAGIIALVCVAEVLFFYSGGLLDLSSLSGMYSTFGEWAHTGSEGFGHQKPWHYWLKLIALYEWPALLGLAWAVRYAWPGSDRLLRYLAIYGCGALAAYSIVRYKTPWCVISLLWPFLFLCGDMFQELSKALGSYLERNPGTEARPKSAAILVNGAAGCLLAASFVAAVRLNFFHYTDAKEPYVYVQTFNDIYKLTNPLLALAKQDPANYHLRGTILLSSYHPLPWMLGDFTEIGYWSDDQQPSEIDADFLAIDEDRAARFEESMQGRYFVEEIVLRDSQKRAKVFFAEDVFRSVFPGRTAEFP